MLYLLLANLVVLLHATFVLFVVFGGFAVLRWPRLGWIHVPAAAWGALIEMVGWVCPLTPLENHLREIGGQPGYAGGFVDQYLIPVLYPPGLTRATQITLGIAVVVLNAGVYGWMLRIKMSRGAAGE